MLSKVTVISQALLASSLETSIDFTNSPLYIHKINLQEGLNEGSQVVSLEFASSEGLRNQTTRVSQSYSGQPSDIVEKILRDDSYLKSKKELTVEPTANNVKVVFPNYKPFRCIRHLLNISNSAVANSSPSYLFYETAAGFNFRTFDGLCKEPVKFYFRDNVAPVLNENKVKTSSIENNDETVKKIIEVLDTKIRPAVARDGGDIKFKSFDKGIVKVELQGSCSGCPSSLMTLKQGVQNLLKHYVKEVNSVEAN